ncbi:MAG TPA: ABC transporter ATP-binding protein [Firmicutes bacterium]|jgi:ABC-2 type transport system ATP-binding protein|nr:ABC transporter ATP-binding protein [Bacillota bacterium]HHT42669.1 ABC transporter ATP-binding protein [Bacillota bacterium]
MTVIDVQGLTKRYGRFTAVDGISFQVSRGEIFGFLGPNGVGKTSTIRILTGLSRASEGKCQVLGQEMTPDNRELRRRIGVVFEEPNLYARLSGRQNLEFYAALYGVPRSRGLELLEEFQLLQAGSKPVANYSKGMKQRLLICRALLNDPELLVLDEPTSGLDLASVELIRGRIRAFSEQGKTVFMSTHSLEEADELCHRVAFVNEGRIIAIGDPADLKLRYGQDYVQVDLIPVVPHERLQEVLNELKIVHFTQEGRVVSITIGNDHSLGSQIAALQRLGRILRIHSQEASLREVFKKVLGLGEKDGR